MLTYIARRLLLMVPTLLGITLVVFIVMAASPGGLSVQSLVDTHGLEPEARKALEENTVSMLLLLESTRQLIRGWRQELSALGEMRRATAELERSVGRRLDDQLMIKDAREEVPAPNPN